MEVTEVRVRLVGCGGTEKLLAFATVTFDNSFVVRDLRVIAGANGLFVAMPSRKLTDRCPGCGCRNDLRARHCNGCGRELEPDRAQLDERGRARLHTDIAHPITPRCREKIQAAVLRSYRREEENLRRSDYRPQIVSTDGVEDTGPDGVDDDVPHQPGLPEA